MAAAVVTPSRLTALAKARCTIFKTAYNPTSARTDIDLCMSKFSKEWPELELVNFAEAQRVWDVDMKRARGKGAPAKAKDKSVSASFVFSVAD
ncbi:hypothetical protein OG21DRAFT_1501060 [Imleria badia]|nr:hypothetical protein OG21DRAFT_1501060 [Imleria badia]